MDVKHLKERDVGWLGGFASRRRGCDEICPGAVNKASRADAMGMADASV